MRLVSCDDITKLELVIVLTNIDSISLENIDLKGKGRMRGQAFVTFSNVDSASQALARIHGVVLEEKPLIVVSFLP